MRIFIFLVALFTAGVSLAQKMPEASPYDVRVQRIAYNENDVVEVHAKEGRATQIVFEEGEEILDIATGYTEGWEIKKRRNHLYLKPKSVKYRNKEGREELKKPSELWNTNLNVTTHFRAYSFELILDEKGANNAPNKIPSKSAYRITFKYPTEEHKKRLSHFKEKAIEKALDHAPVPLNVHYTMKVRKDSVGIAPSKAFDDGRFTYLTFPGNQEFPAVFLVENNKQESLVNTHIDPKHPDVLVIQRVAPAFMLRSGKKVVGVFNERMDVHGSSNHSGTTVPSIRRVTRDNGD